MGDYVISKGGTVNRFNNTVLSINHQPKKQTKIIGREDVSTF